MFELCLINFFGLWHAIGHTGGIVTKHCAGEAGLVNRVPASGVEII